MPKFVDEIAMNVHQRIAKDPRYRDRFSDKLLVSELPEGHPITVWRQQALTPERQAAIAAKKNPHMVTKYAGNPTVAEHLVGTAERLEDSAQHMELQNDAMSEKLHMVGDPGVTWK